MKSLLSCLVFPCGQRLLRRASCAVALAVVWTAFASTSLSAQVNTGEFVLRGFSSGVDVPKSLPHAISLLATKFDANLDWRDFALGYLETEKRQRFSSIQHDPAKVEAELQKAIAEFKSKSASVTPYLTINMEFLVNHISPEGQLVLGSMIGDGEYTIDTVQQKARSYILPAYSFLFANGPISASYKIKPALANRLLTLQEGGALGKLRVELELEVVAFHQHEFINAVVRKASVFVPAIQAEAIAQNVEKADAKKLLAKRFLSDGVTIGLVPDHGTIADGYYMQEFLLQDDTDFQCAEAPRERGHRVVLCDRKQRNDAEKGRRIVHKYVGGRRVEVATYFTEKNPPGVEAEMANLVHQAGQADQQSVGTTTMTKGCCVSIVDINSYKTNLKKPVYVVRSRSYIDMLAGKPGYEVRK